MFRRVTRAGTVWGSGLSEKVVWHVVGQYARKAGIDKLAPHDLRRYAEFRTMPNQPTANSFWAVESGVAIVDFVHSCGIARTPFGFEKVGQCL